MIIDYEKNKKLENKNREKSYLVSSNSLISLGITNYSTNLSLSQMEIQRQKLSEFSESSDLRRSPKSISSSPKIS